MNAVRTFIVILALSIGLGGCGWLVDTRDHTDPRIEALRSITVELKEIPPIDLNKYKDIEFMVVEDVDGQKWVTLHFRDYKKLAALLREIRNYVKIQNKAMKRIDEYYQQALGGQDVDRVDKQSP